MKINDDNYIDELLKKNSKALDFVVDKYSNLIFKVVGSVLNSDFNNQYVEECVNDVFLAIWNNIDSFHKEKGIFKYWITAIAKYKAIDYKRKLFKESVNESLEDYDVSNEENIEKLIIAKENKREVLNAIKCMAKEDKEIFIRRYFLDEGIENIAKAFGFNRNWVDKRLSRGRKSLKEKLMFLKGEMM